LINQGKTSQKWF